jgi:hypothetical protein
MNDLAASFQKTTTYSDDLISEMQALLFEVGQVAPHAMQGALQASTDLAAGLGIDLETATQAVAKAFAGNTDALKKYGITVDEATLKSEGMSAVLDEINQRFGGQAAAATETYSGKIKQLANEWDNLKEAVGGFIVQQPATIGLLRDTTNQFAAADVEGSKFLETLRQYRWFPGLAQISSGIDLLNDHYRELNDQAALFKQTAALLPKAPPSITPPAAPGLGDQSGVVAQQLEEQRQLNAAQKAAESAAKQHAETLKKLREDLYGATAIAQAQNYTAVVTDTSRLSAESLAQVNTVVGEGIAAYQRLGQTAPAAMNALYVKTVSLPPVIKGIGTAVVGTQVALKDLQAMPWPITDKLAQLTRGTGEAEKAMVKLGHTVGQEMNRSAAAATAFFDKMRAELARAEAFGREIAQRIIGGIQSGNIGASLGAVFGGNLGSMLGDKLGKAIGSKLGSALGGMLGPIGALLGEKLGGLVDKLFGGLFNRHKGRDLVVEFAESMGGFDALQQKLEALGAAGAGLWEKLTQKVGKNDTAAATAAIAEIEAALAKAGETSDAVTAVTEEQARATIETASEAAKALEDLGPKIQANEDEWRSWGDAVTAQINAIADRIRAMPMPPVLTPGAAATAMTNGTTAPPSGGGGGTAVLNLDGREIARAVVPRIPGVVQRYGLA